MAALRNFNGLASWKNAENRLQSVNLTMPVIFRRREALAQFVASGASYRIDPVKPLSLAAPGEGVEPGPSAPDVAGQPIVAIVDGGLSSSKYKAAEAWASPPFVADGVANKKHGNRVSSLVVHGHQWNSQRSLPALNCRLGTVQGRPACQRKSCNRFRATCELSGTGRRRSSRHSHLEHIGQRARAGGRSGTDQRLRRLARPLGAFAGSLAGCVCWQCVLEQQRTSLCAGRL